MKDLIYCQRDIPKEKWRYGLRSSAAVGCGWIATYNALRLMGEEAEIAAAEQALAARLPACNVVRSSPILLEIMSREVTKAAGIEAMLRAFSLTPAQAISFGDNYNDIPMLSYTGEGVAMGNAPEAVRQAASAVTLANTEDGSAAYLKRQGLIR